MLVFDKHINRDTMLKKLQSGELFVARDNGNIVGYARYGFFWDELPFLNLIIVSTKAREQGVGTMMMDHWEEAMRLQGFKKVLTSSLVDETAQHFYRKRGYHDIGSFVLPGETTEILFLKEL